MEIIHLILGKANPNRMNGVNKVVYQLATEQAKAGKSVSVWGITKNLDHNYGDRQFSTRLFKAALNPLWINDELRTAIKQKRAKAVFHLHGGWIPVYSRLSKFFTRHQIPFVLTPHGAYNTVAMERSKWKKKVYFQLFEKSLLTRARKIHAIGKSEVIGLNAIFKTEKSFLQPYGFDLKELNDQSRPFDSSFIIGFVGRLDLHTKGLDLLISAFSGFLQAAPNAQLWIVGDGPDTEELRSRVRSGKIENVVFWGSRFGDEKDALISQMDIFAHPSRNEGLPSAVLEACAMKVPCVVSVATNVGAQISDFKAGVVVRDEDVPGFTIAFEVLYDLWKNGGLAPISQNARRMVQEAFNWKVVVEEFDALYSE